MLKTIIKTISLLVLGLFPCLALADLNTASFTVSATVIKACLISISNMSFGTYDPTSSENYYYPATGTIHIICTKGSTPIISMNGGNNFQNSSRRMKNGTEYLNYVLYKPSSNTPNAACPTPSSTVTQWGNGSIGGNPFTLTAAPSIADRSYFVCGQLQGGQDVSTGTGAYTDTVIATVDFVP